MTGSMVAADPAPAAPTAVLDARPASRRHALYLELFGKGGTWGAGYAYAIRPWLGLGTVVSFAVIDHVRVASLSPYATLYPLGRGQHRAFVDVGPRLVHVSTPSPVPEWPGTSDTGIGAQLSAGYELRAGILVRVFAMAVAGKNGVAPWVGLDLGWTL